jgi:hypothetical protein
MIETENGVILKNEKKKQIELLDFLMGYESFRRLQFSFTDFSVVYRSAKVTAHERIQHL